MSKYLFQFETVSVIQQKRIEKYSWFQRLIIKWFKIEITNVYDVTLKIRLYKPNFLEPNQMILLGNEASPTYFVIAKYANDNREYLIKPVTHLTLEAIKHALTKTSGFVWASALPDNQFVRNKPIT